jgi:hypothetical protein
MRSATAFMNGSSKSPDRRDTAEAKARQAPDCIPRHAQKNLLQNYEVMSDENTLSFLRKKHVSRMRAIAHAHV